MGVIQVTDVHPNLYMASSQTIRDLQSVGETVDQYGNVLTLKSVRIVCVASKTLCSEFKDIASSYIIRDLPNQEFATTAHKATDEVCKHLKRRRKVIVFCNMGRNRSSLVVMLYMYRNTSCTYTEAFNVLLRCNSRRLGRPQLLSNPEYSTYLRKMFDQRRA